MQGHDVIVIGASAGGIKALSTLFQTLPADFPAAIVAVLHLSPDSPGLLPKILSSASAVPARQAQDGEPLRSGQIYLPRPGHHLLLESGCLQVRQGPKENLFRPSIDALFRSAARAYGPRVVGVILTGSLYDGAAGLHAVKKRGGVAIIQEPSEAAFPSMPTIAQRYVEVDYCLPLAEITPLLVRLSQAPITTVAGEYPMPDLVEIESLIANQNLNSMELLQLVEQIGKRSTYTCPECHGTLWEIEDGKLLRFRCHVGHAITVDQLQVEQSVRIEESLWSALRSLEEKVALAENLAARAHYCDRREEAKRHSEEAQLLDERVSALRHFIMNNANGNTHQ